METPGAYQVCEMRYKSGYYVADATKYGALVAKSRAVGKAGVYHASGRFQASTVYCDSKTQIHRLTTNEGVGVHVVRAQGDYTFANKRVLGGKHSAHYDVLNGEHQSLAALGYLLTTGADRNLYWGLVRYNGSVKNAFARNYGYRVLSKLGIPKEQVDCLAKYPPSSSRKS